MVGGTARGLARGRTRWVAVAIIASMGGSSTRVMLTGAALVGAGFFTYLNLQPRQEQRPVDSPVAFESAQEKADNVQAAFAGATEVDDAEVEAFVERVQAAAREQDPAKLASMVAFDRLLDAIEATTGRKPGAPRPSLEARLQPVVVKFFDPTVVQTTIKRIDHDDEGNLVVYLRMIDDERISTKARWWLHQEGNELRWWDSEDLEVGLRVSTGMSAVVSSLTAGGDQQRLMQLAQTITRFAETPADDTAQMTALAGDLDALNTEGVPRAFRHVVIVTRASVSLVLGEAEDALRRLDALDREGLKRLEVPMRHFLRASACQGLERWDEAVQAAHDYLALLGDDADAYNIVGFAQFELGNVEAALAAFDAGIADDPRSVANYAGVAAVTQDATQVARRIEPVTDPELLDEVAQWLVDSADPKGLETLLTAAATTAPSWHVGSWRTRLDALRAEPE